MEERWMDGWDRCLGDMMDWDRRVWRGFGYGMEGKEEG